MIAFVGRVMWVLVCSFVVLAIFSLIALVLGCKLLSGVNEIIFWILMYAISLFLGYRIATSKSSAPIADNGPAGKDNNYEKERI